MPGDPRAFYALDEGVATRAAALIARVDGRWRLLAAAQLPAAVEREPILALLAERVALADPGLARSLRISATRADALPLVVAATERRGSLAVVAASERARAPFVAAALRAGWRVVGGSLDRDDALALTAVLLDPTTDAVVVGAGEPPGPDERAGLDELIALAAAAAARRPELTVVLAGSTADRMARFEPGAEPVAQPAASTNGTGAGVDGTSAPLNGSTASLATGGTRQGIRVAPAPTTADAPTSPLRALLEELVSGGADSRRGMARALGSLADALDRRIELLEVGFSGGLRALAAPGTGDDPGTVVSASVADGGLVPAEPDGDHVDQVLAWSTLAADRHRLWDQLRELRLAPWGDIAGDGAPFRLAAARSALARLVAATPEIDELPAPDLLLVAGGVWAVAPGPAIALAIADSARRAAAIQLSYDHARLLGPLGTIDDPAERRAIVGDLADDLLVPLGSVVMPQGLRVGRGAGRLVVHTADGTTEMDLIPGGLDLVDLPPGASATVEFQFRDQITLGSRGRHFAVDVAGGLGGLLVDLRDVPLRLPDRSDRRRELLAAWQHTLWAGLEG